MIKHSDAKNCNSLAKNLTYFAQMRTYRYESCISNAGQTSLTKKSNWAEHMKTSFTQLTLKPFQQMLSLALVFVLCIATVSNLAHAANPVAAGGNILDAAAAEPGFFKKLFTGKWSLRRGGNKYTDPNTSPGTDELIAGANASSKVLRPLMKDNLAEASENIFTDLQIVVNNTDLPPLIGHQSEIDSLITHINTSGTEGAFLVGNAKSGRQHLLKEFQRQINEGRHPQLGNLHIIMVNTDHSNFTNFREFKSMLSEKINDELLSKIESVQPGTPRFVFALEHTDNFARGELAETAHITQFVDTLKQTFGSSTFVVARTSQADANQITSKASRIQDRWKQVSMRVLDEDEVLSALREYLKVAKLKIGDQSLLISDDELNTLHKFAQTHFSDSVSPGRDIELLAYVIERKKTAILNGYSDEIAKGLHQKARELEKEFEEMQALAGPEFTHASERVAKIPQELSELNAEIAKIEGHFNLITTHAKLMRSRIEIEKAIQGAKGELSNTNNLSDATKAALTQKLAAFEKQLVATNSQIDELAENANIYNVTRDDIAYAVYDLKKPNADYLKIASERRTYTEDEAVEEISKRLFGQDQLLKLIRPIFRSGEADALTRSLSRPDKPEFTTLILGPPGTGKTEFVKLLSKYLKDDNFIKLAMGEYGDQMSATRLSGAAPGFVGHDQGSELVNKLRELLKAGISFDEIEKAHPDVFKVLLNFLWDGVITDGRALQGSAKNSFVAMTSNALQDLIKEGKITATTPEHEVREMLKRSNGGPFLDEFVDRIDAIVVTTSLSKENQAKIVAKQLGDLRYNMQRKGYGLQDDISVGLKIYGDLPADKISTREIERAITRSLTNNIDEILRNKRYINAKGESVTIPIKKGQTLNVRWDDNLQDWRFTIRQRATSPSK